MALAFASGGGGGGGGGVATVTAADTSIVIAGTAANPTVATGTLDVIAADHPPAAAVALNSKKITGLANGTLASDAAAFGQIPTALPPNGAAGGDLTGTFPDPTVGNVSLLTTKGDLLWASAAGTAARLAVGAQAQTLSVGSGSALAYAYPPGYEYDYVQITSSVTITGTTDATATAVIDGNAVTYDGSTRIKLEFFALGASITSAQELLVVVYDGATDLGKLAVLVNDSATATHDEGPLYGAMFLTPSAGAHTFHVKAWKTGGTISIYAGAGGAGAVLPTWYRITQA